MEEVEKNMDKRFTGLEQSIAGLELGITKLVEKQTIAEKKSSSPDRKPIEIEKKATDQA